MFTGMDVYAEVYVHAHEEEIEIQEDLIEIKCVEEFASPGRDDLGAVGREGSMNDGHVIEEHALRLGVVLTVDLEEADGFVLAGGHEQLAVRVPIFTS